MASRGYYFDFVDGERYAVPSPGVLLCPVRSLESNYPDWIVEFTRGDILYFRRFGDYPTYSLEKLGDGTFELRDVGVDTVMYTMTPVYDSSGDFEKYTVEWKEHLSESYPEECKYEDNFLLPTTDDGDEWVEYYAEFNYLLFPVYHLNYTTLDDEDVVEYECRYLLELYYESENMYGCSLWNTDTKEADIEFQFDRGEYDTQGRRIYPLRWVDCSVLFDDDGFSLHDADGDRIGNAVRFEHDDDEGFNDGWGMDSLSGLAYETYLEWFSVADSETRHYSAALQREVWDNAVDSEANPLDKIARIIRTGLDAKLDSDTFPIEVPANHMRKVEGTDIEIRRTGTRWSVYDGDELKYTVVGYGRGNDAAWDFYGTDGTVQRQIRPVGDGTYDFSSTDGTVHLVLHAQETLDDFEPGGEFDKANLYAPIRVTDTSGNLVYEIGRPERMEDPFDDLTFVEFTDSVPLRLVDGAWITYDNKPKWYVTQSDNVNFWRDIYDSHNELAYRIYKPSDWDDDDREIYSADNTKVARMTLLSLISDKTGAQVAKLYADPSALYTYQLFDNGVGGYNYLTHYSNDMVVVLSQSGEVTCYIMPDGSYRGRDFELIGYVTVGNKVVDPQYNTLYTFKQSGGDWNLYDADGNLVGRLFSETEPNNEWVMGDGMQRLFTFLATETKAVVDADGKYVFVGEDGSYLNGSVKVQVESNGALVLTILDSDGAEKYRITAIGGTYQINAANGVAFDTAKSYETFSSGNMVLTRYWSTPYNRMMYSCTNDQPEGAFDDVIAGYAAAGASGGRIARYSVAGVDGGSVSDSGIRVLSGAGAPRTLAATSTSEGTEDSSGGAMSSPDTIQDLMDTMSDYYDSVNGILSKDTNTSKGDDLDPDNPLQMSHAETDGRQLANAAFASLGTMTSTEKQALSDAYDYTQAITRVSKMYSLGRADIYQEAQDYAATRTKRIEAKKAIFTQVMTKSKERAEKEQS